jgi:hypothetical protein
VIRRRPLGRPQGFTPLHPAAQQNNLEVATVPLGTFSV